MGWRCLVRMPQGLRRHRGLISTLFLSISALQPSENGHHPLVPALATQTIVLEHPKSHEEGPGTPTRGTERPEVMCWKACQGCLSTEASGCTERSPKVQTQKFLGEGDGTEQRRRALRGHERRRKANVPHPATDQ